MKPKYVIGLIFAGLVLIILLQNTQVVSLKFLFWEISMSRIIFFPALVLLGVIAGFIAGKKL